MLEHSFSYCLLFIFKVVSSFHLILVLRSLQKSNENWKAADFELNIYHSIQKKLGKKSRPEPMAWFNVKVFALDVIGIVATFPFTVGYRFRHQTLLFISRLVCLNFTFYREESDSSFGHFSWEFINSLPCQVDKKASAHIQNSSEKWKQYMKKELTEFSSSCFKWMTFGWCIVCWWINRKKYTQRTCR